MCNKYCVNQHKTHSDIQYIENCPNIVRLSEFGHLSPNLRVLYLSNCTNLVAVDISHIDVLIITNCPNLETISTTMFECAIDDSTKVVQISSSLLRHFSCTNPNRYIESQFFLPRIDISNNGPFIRRNNALLIRLQRWCKKNQQYWRFSRWIRSREFNEWFYAPGGIGGRMHIKCVGRVVGEICAQVRRISID